MIISEISKQNIQIYVCGHKNKKKEQTVDHYLTFSVDIFRPVLVTPMEGRNDYINAVIIAVGLPTIGAAII